MDNSARLADGDSRIRKVDANGIITTFAGDGTPNFSGDGGPATEASIQFPTDVLAGNNGEVFIADTGNFRVRKVDAQGFILTIAGSGIDVHLSRFDSSADARRPSHSIPAGSTVQSCTR